MSSYNERFVRSQQNRSVICLAQPACSFDKRIEYFLEIERRTADDLQDVGCGGLACICFRQSTFKRCVVLVGGWRLFRPGRPYKLMCLCCSLFGRGFTRCILAPRQCFRLFGVGMGPTAPLEALGL